MIPLRVLFVEDVDDDAQLVVLELERAGYRVAFERVETESDLCAALERKDWDIVLSDYSMPHFDALSALKTVHQSRQRDLPFILISGSIGEVSAVEALKAGASDFVMKTNLARLVPAMARELADAQVRRERKEALDALRLAVRARDDFLSIAAHELRTPLAALQLQTEGLLRLARRGAAGLDLTEERVLQRLATIERSARRLTDLVERLLDITTVTRGQLALQTQRTDLAALTRKVLETLEDSAQASGSAIRLQVPDEGVFGYWDAERLETVVSNLLVNAIKYGQGRPIEVRVRCENDHAQLAVIDQGIGISEPDQQRIFNRFERAVPEKHFGGLGIGLWLAHQIVGAHGGTIQVSSRAGEGSTFTIELPKNTPAAIAPDASSV